MYGEASRKGMGEAMAHLFALVPQRGDLAAICLHFPDALSVVSSRSLLAKFTVLRGTTHFYHVCCSLANQLVVSFSCAIRRLGSIFGWFRHRERFKHVINWGILGGRSLRFWHWLLVQVCFSDQPSGNMASIQKFVCFSAGSHMAGQSVTWTGVLNARHKALGVKLHWPS